MTFAPGKVILTGEHAVVYGYPAIAMPISLGVTISIEYTDGPSFCPQAHLDRRLWTAMRTLIPEDGYKISIHSSLPLGRGMGSSAALSVALVRAMAKLKPQQPTFEEECTVAMTMEKVFHGNPSGLDHTVSALGQSIYFHKTSLGIKWNPLTVPDLKFLVIDSGTAGSTAEMVAKVARHSHEQSTTNILKEIGTTTVSIHSALEQRDIEETSRLCLHNHTLLRDLGVSTPVLDLLVEESMNMGAWGAKLSGSGGGGIVLTFGPDLEKYKLRFEQLGYESYILSPVYKRSTPQMNV